MRADWESATVGELCDVVNGGTPKTGVTAYWDGPHQWITPAEMGRRASPYIEQTERTITDEGLQNSSARLLPAYSVILSSRAPIGHLMINTAPMATNQGCKGLVPRGRIDHKFLYYYLGSIVDLLNDLGTGATFKELSGGKLREVRVPVPSTSEQKRIVAILDEAFEGIAAAKTNAEKNLRNAQELYGRISGVVLAQAMTAGRIKTLEEVVEPDCTLSYGIVQPGDELADGLPIVRPVDLNRSVVRLDGLKRIEPALAEAYKRTTLKGNDILLCVRGTTGALALADSELAGANVTRGIVPIRFDSAQLSQAFGYCLMRSEPVQMQIRAKTYGAALMQINIRDLRQLTVKIPPLQEQEIVVQRLGDVQAASEQLVTKYERKLAALGELKKSLLHQAFSGQLTSLKQTSINQQPARQTHTPEFAASVIAIAYARHERQRREKTFGRVKEQKVLHLVEAIANVDMGRQPMRDAAGPNDFQHMLKAEEWARGHKLFEMINRGGGYELRKLSAFDEYLSNARQALAPYLPQLEPVIDLLVPMDTEEAEVFATVHAAWNNLLLDGIQATDDAIVSAARDDWHPDKLNIPEHKFRSAIELLRQKKLVPDGSAKYVGGQQSLL